MARLRGVEERPSLLARVIFFLAKRGLGRIPRPLRISALSRRVLWGFGQMENAQAGLRAVDAGLVKLAQVRVATRVGCPF